MALEMKIHGTYPFDSGHWQTLREITRDEAADLVNAPLELREMKDAYGKNPKYLWLNKGFVVLGMPEGMTPGLGLAMAEQFCNPEVKGIPVDAQAVTIHDGTYYLLKYVGSQAR